MDQQAKGEFDVSRSAEPSCDMGDGAVVGRHRFDKRFHGGLDASSVVQMLVVPDSGTGELAGLSGRMSIDIVEGKHFYTFDCALDAAD